MSNTISDLTGKNYDIYANVTSEAQKTSKNTNDAKKNVTLTISYMEDTSNSTAIRKQIPLEADSVEEMFSMLEQMVSGNKIPQEILGKIKEILTQAASTSQKNEVQPELVVKSILNNIDNIGSVDKDMRELMKLLIQAFSELMNTQREIDLRSLKNLTDQFAAKISEMKNAQKAQYNAARTQAWTSILSGFVAIGISCISTKCIISGAKSMSAPGFDANKNSTFLLQENSFSKLKTMGEALGQISQAASKIIEGGGGLISADHINDKEAANIRMQESESVSETVRKMQEQSQAMAKKLMDFVENALNIIKVIQQSMASAEKTIIQA